jgi:hypothetical protein
LFPKTKVDVAQAGCAYLASIPFAIRRYRALAQGRAEQFLAEKQNIGYDRSIQLLARDPPCQPARHIHID